MKNYNEDLFYLFCFAFFLNTGLEAQQNKTTEDNGRYKNIIKDIHYLQSILHFFWN